MQFVYCFLNTNYIMHTDQSFLCSNKFAGDHREVFVESSRDKNVKTDHNLGSEEPNEDLEAD